LLSYDRLSKKPLLFKSFTGLNVKEFDDIYDREISKRYRRHEIKRLSNRKDCRERSIGAGRHFKMDVKNRFLVLFCVIYYRLYITCTLAGFLFGLDLSNICRDIEKIEPLVRKCMPIPQKMHKTAKRLRTPDEVEKMFPGFLSFTDCTEQQIPRPESKTRRKAHYSGKRKRHTVKTQIMVNNCGIIIHKTNHKKGKRHDYVFNI
jgi:DDE superfamily endonuclease